MPAATLLRNGASGRRTKDRRGGFIVEVMVKQLGAEMDVASPVADIAASSRAEPAQWNYLICADQLFDNITRELFAHP
jgi:hypothetical protein